MRKLTADDIDTLIDADGRAHAYQVGFALEAGEELPSREHIMGELLRQLRNALAMQLPHSQLPCKHETLVNPTDGHGWRCRKCGAPVSPTDPFRSW